MDLLIPYDGSIDGEKNASVIAANRPLRRHHPFQISRLDISAKPPFRTSPTTWKRSTQSDPKLTPKVLVNRLYERADPICHRQEEGAALRSPPGGSRD